MITQDRLLLTINYYNFADINWFNLYHIFSNYDYAKKDGYSTINEKQKSLK